MNAPVLLDTPPAPVIKVRGELLTELPQDLYIPPDALEVFLDAFEGPLDHHAATFFPIVILGAVSLAQTPLGWRELRR